MLKLQQGKEDYFLNISFAPGITVSANPIHIKMLHIPMRCTNIHSSDMTAQRDTWYDVLCSSAVTVSVEIYEPMWTECDSNAIPTHHRGSLLIDSLTGESDGAANSMSVNVNQD